MTDHQLIARLETRIDRLEAIVARLTGGGNRGAADPTIGVLPIRGWTGASQCGLRMSQCEPAFLRVYAAALTGLADTAERGGNAYVARRNRRTAERALAWFRALTPPAEEAGAER